MFSPHALTPSRARLVAALGDPGVVAPVGRVHDVSWIGVLGVGPPALGEPGARGAGRYLPAVTKRAGRVAQRAATPPWTRPAREGDPRCFGWGCLTSNSISPVFLVNRPASQDAPHCCHHPPHSIRVPQSRAQRLPYGPIIYCILSNIKDVMLLLKRMTQPTPPPTPALAQVAAAPEALVVSGGWQIEGLPPTIRRAGPQAAERTVEFFTAQIRNPHTRAAYAAAVTRFFTWCDARGLALTHFPRSPWPPTSKRCKACIAPPRSSSIWPPSAASSIGWGSTPAFETRALADQRVS